ncbi:MAG: hypothetical protein O7G30_00775 [Proteobacteria bacterium]|nr:hypothetical protein [Pseudomonadota bacterium]
MSERGSLPRDSRDALRRSVRDRIRDFGPSLRVIAEDVMGERSTADLVAVDDRGQVTLILIGEAGDDPTLLTRALALCSWVSARLADWAQIGPELRLDPDAPVRAVLLCPDFDPETRSAAASLGAQAPVLACYREAHNGAQDGFWIEAASPSVGATARAATGLGRHTPEPAVFRSGLSEADLHLTAEERRDFES